MILNEAQILERLLDPDPERRIIITPLIHPEEQFGPTSIDLRLGTYFQVLVRSNLTHLDLVQSPETLASDLQKCMTSVKVNPTEPFVLHPGEFGTWQNRKERSGSPCLQGGPLPIAGRDPRSGAAGILPTG